MASKAQKESERPAPRLYLVTPPVKDAAAFARALEPALAAADIAAVLLRLEPDGESELVGRIKLLAPLVQRAGAAVDVADRQDAPRAMHRLGLCQGRCA